MNMKMNDNISFTISQVAQILGVVPATIRNWEKNGLITSKRSSNNYRMFTLDDITTLQKIREYSVEKHMGNHAIKMLLPAHSDTDIENYVEQQKEGHYSKSMLSAKWREIREQKGYTLEEVSQAVDISPAHLSKIENGNVNISIEYLNRLAAFYRESPLFFVESTMEENHLVRKDCGEPIQIRVDPGVEMTSLIAQKSHMMYPTMCTVDPGCGNLVPHTHNGEELIYLFSGVIKFWLNDDLPYILHPGDTFYYLGSDRHCWQNVSSKKAKMLWVHSALSKQ